MCFTYRILEPIGSNIHLSMFSPALEKATSKAEVQFPAVYCLQSTPPPQETVDMTDDSDSSDEFFEALTGEDLTSLSMEDVQAFSPIHVEEDWTQDVWPQENWAQGDWDQGDCTQENCTQEGTDSHTDQQDNTSEPEHPLAGWHSERLAQSSWTDHSFIDKSDHIDTWARHSEYSLARCTWSVYPESAWPKPESDWCPWGGPELRLITPEGEICWLDDPTDYEALPWEKDVAEERNRILSAIW